MLLQLKFAAAFAAMKKTKYMPPQHGGPRKRCANELPQKITPKRFSLPVENREKNFCVLQ